MSDTPEDNIYKVSANLGCASDTLGVLDQVLLNLSAEVKAILRERDEARETVTRLNRRLTKAEGIIAASGIVEGRPHKGGGSLGRALANYAADKYKRERDEARKSEIAAVAEREKWRLLAEEKWAMRRELEEILEVPEGATCDEQFAKGVEALRQLKRERNEARKQLRVAVGLLSTTPQFQDQHPEEVLKFIEESAK